MDGAGRPQSQRGQVFWTGGPVQVAPDTWFTSVGSGVTAFATSDGLVLVDSGTRLFAQVAREPGVNHETLRTWVRTAEAAQRPGAAAESAKDAELARLRKEVAELRLEREILRKAAAHVAGERLD